MLSRYASSVALSTITACEGKSVQNSVHATTHFPAPFRGRFLERRAARVAYWKTSRTPSPVRAEHSRYCLAPIFCATAMPCSCLGQKSTIAWVVPPHTSSGVTGLWFVFLSSSTTLGSRRRSFLQATRIIGSPGQKCITSEIHCTTALTSRVPRSGTTHPPSLERCPASQGSRWRSTPR